MNERDDMKEIQWERERHVRIKLTFLLMLSVFHIGNGKASKVKEDMVSLVIYSKDPQNILHTPAEPFPLSDLNLAKETAQKLLAMREQIGGGAGLAAPQIGINHPIFIYTPDRTTVNLRVVINPSYRPIGETQVWGEEACFSVPLHMTTLPRYEKIKVSYTDLEGNPVEEVLDGFAAKVFQHEMDHLQGILTIDHEEAKVQAFQTEEDFQNHMNKVRQGDAKRYR